MLPTGDRGLGDALVVLDAVSRAARAVANVPCVGLWLGSPAAGSLAGASRGRSSHPRLATTFDDDP